MNNLNSKEALETEHSKLDYIINQIQKITSKYCSIQTDEVRVNKAPKISIEQDADGPNLNLSAVANKPVAEAYFSISLHIKDHLDRIILNLNLNFNRAN